MRRSKAPSHSNRPRKVEGNTVLSSAKTLGANVNKQFKRPLREDARKTRSNGEGVVSVVRRTAFLPFLRAPSGKTHILHELLNKPFKTPCRPGFRTEESNILLKKKRLGCMPGRKTLKGGVFRKPSLLVESGEALEEQSEEGSGNSKKLDHLPPYDPLVVWDEAKDLPENDDNENENSENVMKNSEEKHRIIVPEILGRFLRPHQREGVRFLFDCVLGKNRERQFDGLGCILADDMGLGKTLQSITLLYTLLVEGYKPKKPIAKRIIVVCPTSLVRNWENEIQKWLENRVKVVAISESAKKEVIKQVKAFTNTSMYQCLVISYDTFRLHNNLFSNQNCCDLLICDEAHRLKNDQTLTSKALDGLACKRRVLLSGTPLQNDLEEFFSMVNFCNPGILGTVSDFRKVYQNPILIGREPDATEKEVQLSEDRTEKLSNIVNNFILRRTNTLNVKYLPPKLTQVVCVKLTEFQKKLYNHMMQAKVLLDQCEANKGVTAMALSSINSMKKLCNHAQLVYQPTNTYGDANGSAKKKKRSGYGMEEMNSFFPEGFAGASNRRSRSRAPLISSSSNETSEVTTTMKNSNLQWSGKFRLVDNMLRIMKAETDDRMVIVSNYTQTLDLLAILFKERGYEYVRLDGSISAKKRQHMVDRLNDPKDNVFIFLLSSKAGGCGLNLIGANRLILFDPDWNPATDKQAAARVWREGQAKRTFVYRFLATGTIEEKIYQRQLSKEGLQSVVADDMSMESSFASRDLKDLFSLKEDTMSDTHDKFTCDRCVPNKPKIKDKCNNVKPGESDIVSMEGVQLNDRNEHNIDDIQGEKAHCSSKSPSAGPPSGIKRRKRFHVRTTEAEMKRRKEALRLKAEQREKLNPPPKPNASQIGFPGEGDLNEWSHHHGSESCDDFVLRRAGEGLVTFCYGQVIDGAMMSEEDLQEKPKKQKKEIPKKKSESGSQEEKPSSSLKKSKAAKENKKGNSSSTPGAKAASMETKKPLQEKSKVKRDSLSQLNCPEARTQVEEEKPETQNEEVQSDDDFLVTSTPTTAIKDSSIPKEEWSCSSCTYINPNKSMQCGMCTQPQTQLATPISTTSSVAVPISIDINDTTKDSGEMEDIWACGDHDKIFAHLWPMKKKQKWRCVPGSGLYNYYYLAPGVKKKNGILGYNMFGTIETLVTWWKNNPEQ